MRIKEQSYLSNISNQNNVSECHELSRRQSEFSKFLSNTDKSVCLVKDLHY